MRTDRIVTCLLCIAASFMVSALLVVAFWPWSGISLAAACVTAYAAVVIGDR